MRGDRGQSARRECGEHQLPRRRRPRPVVAFGASALLATLALVLALGGARAQDSRPLRFLAASCARRRSAQSAALRPVPEQHAGRRPGAIQSASRTTSISPRSAPAPPASIRAGYAAPARAEGWTARPRRKARRRMPPRRSSPAAAGCRHRLVRRRRSRLSPIEQPAPTLTLPETMTTLRPVGAGRHRCRRSRAPYVLEPAPPVPLRRILPYEVNPFEAVGTTYGSFLFRPAVEVTRGYDTNPARTMRAQRVLVRAGGAAAPGQFALVATRADRDLARRLLELRQLRPDEPAAGRLQGQRPLRHHQPRPHRRRGPLLSRHRLARQPEHPGRPEVAADLSPGRRHRRAWASASTISI